MDALLARVTSQAINYAIRSGVAVTGTYAIRQCTRLLQNTPRGRERKDLGDLQARLQSKIRIISPAIDMIDLIAARGNTSLESAVALTKDLRWEIQALGVRLANAANEEELARRSSSKAKSREQIDLEIQLIIKDIKNLLAQIEDAVPLINLAITTSGVNLTTNLPATISPSRLLQASTFLSAADSQYAVSPDSRVQVGPTYTLSMYMLFAGHAYRPQDEEDIRQTTWKEVIHKARVKLIRTPLDRLYDLPGQSSSKTNGHARAPAADSVPSENATSEFAYQLLIIEDLDDDRVHTFEEDESQPGPVDDVELAGVRDVLPIHEVSKIFYADTGKILNIGSEGEVNSPVLLLKRDIYAQPPRRMMERQTSVEDLDAQDIVDDFPDHDFDEPLPPPRPSDEQAELDAQFGRESMPTALPTQESVQVHETWRLPRDLDPEWIAFEVYNEEPDSEDENEMSGSNRSRPSSSRDSVGSGLGGALARLSIAPSSSNSPSRGHEQINDSPMPNPLPSPSRMPIKSSLSMLEMLIRLTALQQFRQSSHLTIEDELLNFFLEDSSTTGAGANAEYRQRVRRDARRRVGFDPYDESPIKRRGEEYLAHPRASPRPQDDWEHESQYGRGSPDYVRSSIEYPLHRQSTPAGPSSPSPSMRPAMRSTRSSPIPATPARPPSVQTMTPPGSLLSRQAVLRAMSEKPSSPLGQSATPGQKSDSALGTSPSSEKLADREA